MARISNERPIAELLAKAGGAVKKKGNKFNAKKTRAYGYTFDSKHEADHYVRLRMRMDVGDILRVHRQVKFDLPGGTTLTVDFMFIEHDGLATVIRYQDAKGSKHTRAYQEWNRVRKICEDLYNITIEEV